MNERMYYRYVRGGGGGAGGCMCVCKREFTEKYSLTRDVKSPHLCWSCKRCRQRFNQRDNYEMHQPVRLFKTTGKRKSDGHLTAKGLKHNTTHVVGAPNGTVNEYHLNLEDEQQDTSNVLEGVLKESTFRMENRINEEVGKKRAVKFYLSLHVNLSTDVAFLTDPPAVLSTDSCDVHDALNSTYENLVSAIEDFQQRGPGWNLDKLIALDLHLLEFDPLQATSYLPLSTCIQNKKAVINIKDKDDKCFLRSVIAGWRLSCRKS